MEEFIDKAINVLEFIAIAIAIIGPIVALIIFITCAAMIC
jgi:hypothetical protein